MGALLDLRKCPSLCAREDGMSRSSSIFSWGNTPELFILKANANTDPWTWNGWPGWRGVTLSRPALREPQMFWRSIIQQASELRGSGPTQCSQPTAINKARGLCKKQLHAGYQWLTTLSLQLVKLCILNIRCHRCIKSFEESKTLPMDG